MPVCRVRCLCAISCEVSKSLLSLTDYPDGFTMLVSVEGCQEIFSMLLTCITLKTTRNTGQPLKVVVPRCQLIHFWTSLAWMCSWKILDHSHPLLGARAGLVPIMSSLAFLEVPREGVAPPHPSFWGDDSTA